VRSGVFPQVPGREPRSRIANARHLSPSGNLLAQRKPTLSFTFVGSFLLRLAARTFLCSLFQEPPRKERGICDRAARMTAAPQRGVAAVIAKLSF
jgi:hypothetical protein